MSLCQNLKTHKDAIEARIRDLKLNTHQIYFNTIYTHVADLTFIPCVICHMLFKGAAI